MARFLLTTLSVLAIASLSAAQIQTWAIDPDHSSAEFGVRHLGISTVHGTFSKVNGKVSYYPADVGKSSIDATIDASTVNTRIEARDQDLRGSDFFDVEKFPTINFKSKRIESAGAGKLLVTGDLTIHGVTKQVVLDVNGPTPAIKDPSGNTRMGADATTKINRHDFGINGGSTTVGDEVQINLDLEMTNSSSPSNAAPSK